MKKTCIVQILTIWSYVKDAFFKIRSKYFLKPHTICYCIKLILNALCFATTCHVIFKALYFATTCHVISKALCFATTVSHFFQSTLFCYNLSHYFQSTLFCYNLSRYFQSALFCYNCHAIFKALCFAATCHVIWPWPYALWLIRALLWSLDMCSSSGTATFFERGLGAENIKYKFRFAQKWPITCINL